MKRISSEESIEKKFISQTMEKSFSAEMLSDIDLQNDQRFRRPHLLKKQEEKQHLDKATKLEAVAKKTHFLDFDQKVKNKGSGKLNAIDAKKLQKHICRFPKCFNI